MKKEDLRPVEVPNHHFGFPGVTDKTKKGWFHIWETIRDSEGERTYAIIEYENGSITRIDPINVKFTDR